MKIHHRIQHTAGRDAALARLLPRLPAEAEVITDYVTERLNPMRNFLRCLADPPPAVTHLCITQDDAWPCDNFQERLEDAVAGRPADLLSLFVGGLSGRTKRDFLIALGNRERWTKVYFREIHFVVATVWPVQFADEFVEWFATARVPGPKVPVSDDAVVGYWARTTRKMFWATVPCLVEHPDDLPSVVQGNRRLGDKGRRAIAFIDDL